MRSTAPVTVCGCFAETTRPTRVRRRDRRHECAGASWAEPWATDARRRGRARFTGATAAGFGAAAAIVFFGAVTFAAVVFFSTAFFGAADFATVFFSAAGAFSAVAVVFFFAVVFFSAIRRLSLSFVHHREHAGNALPRGRQAPIVLQLARCQLEPEVEQLLLRALELFRELRVRQPPHVLQLHCSHLPRPRGLRTSS